MAGWWAVEKVAGWAASRGVYSVVPSAVLMAAWRAVLMAAWRAGLMADCWVDA